MLPSVYPIVDTGILEKRGMKPAMFARALVDGGARILQFRHKGDFTQTAFDEAERVAAVCARAAIPLVIDDRADVAMLLNAGVHLGQDDLPPAGARPLAKGLLGFSTHNEQQLALGDREPVDYLAIGPIFGTLSKDKPDPVLGLDRLAALRRLTRKPLVAIGGITRDRAPEVLAAGIDSVAIIGDLIPDQLSPDSVRRRMEEWLKRTQPK